MSELKQKYQEQIEKILNESQTQQNLDEVLKLYATLSETINELENLRSILRDYILSVLPNDKYEVQNYEIKIIDQYQAVLNPKKVLQLLNDINLFFEVVSVKSDKLRSLLTKEDFEKCVEGRKTFRKIILKRR